MPLETKHRYPDARDYQLRSLSSLTITDCSNGLVLYFPHLFCSGGFTNITQRTNLLLNYLNNMWCVVCKLVIFSISVPIYLCALMHWISSSLNEKSKPLFQFTSRGPVNSQRITSIAAWISNYMLSKLSDEVTFTFPIPTFSCTWLLLFAGTW